MAGNPLAINYAQWLALFKKLTLIAKDALFRSEAADLEVMTRETIRVWTEMPAIELVATDE